MKPGERVASCLGALLWLLVGACDPEVNVGEWTCSEDGSMREAVDARAAIAMPWSASFENRFCDYTEQAGFCYADPEASYTTVTEPVHSGRYAAAFGIATDRPDASQTRCVRQGVLPMAAYYGAWYFVPERVESSALWNLWHFRGGEPSGTHGLWDVSLVNGASGALQLEVYDFLGGRTRRSVNAKPVPIGAWFHIELYLKRAPDNSGAIALYQDGESLLEVNDLRTDDSSWGQWYVGNLASELAPAESILYVDDVTIRASR